ncbi:hypothetical protein [Kitasatospora sp. MBT63]|uniref:hypothetical protein n=1 Tax=Kitasatospora sp. MBT63 TaxID=1444768 RepID=UPI0013148C89|nr:hypothetical protein [Kitasatospora sp. MBT63]
MSELPYRAVPPAREMITDQAGRPAADFVRGATRAGLPWADDIRPRTTVRRAAQAILLGLPGWVASTPVPPLGDLLADRAPTLRLSRLYGWDFDRQHPEPHWLRPRLPDGVRLAGLDGVGAADLAAVRERAYPPGHLDRAPGQPERLTGLLDGTLYGPVLGCSTVARSAGSVVVAAVLVTGNTGLPGRPEPGFVDVFREPGEPFRGLGSLLLRYALARAAVDGPPPALVLSVTDGNPARRVYERIGFSHLDSIRTVLLPDPTTAAHPAQGRSASISAARPSDTPGRPNT